MGDIKMPFMVAGPGVLASIADMKLAEQQPDGVEIKFADDIFVKQMHVAKKFTVIPQHSHTYEHLSMLAVGSVDVWAEEKYLGRYVAPTGIEIKANTAHTFQTLEDNTIIYCIHNISRTGEIEIAEEHHLIEEK